jgi:beta-lactamase regulating signal transducer with metallopeptidase domain
MGSIEGAVATFLLNSAWQVALVAGLAWAITVPIRSAAARHGLWAFSLVLSLILPLASVLPHHDAERLPTVTTGQPDRLQSPALSTPAEQSRPKAGGQSTGIVLHLPGWLCGLLTSAYSLFLVWRLALAVRAWRATRDIRNATTPIVFSEECERAVERCRAAFGLCSPVIASSPRMRVPAAIGSRAPIITVPEGLLRDLSIEEWTAVLGHEMAHIHRHDFGKNLCYEFLSLPVSFHPAAVFMKRRIAVSREQACDDLVTGRVMPALAYARSLVKIAGRISRGKDLSWGIAACDGRGLEARIDRLLSTSGRTTPAAWWPWAAAAVLLVCSCFEYASAFYVDPAAGSSQARSPVPAAETGSAPVASVADSFPPGRQRASSSEEPIGRVLVRRSEPASVAPVRSAAGDVARPSAGSGSDAAQDEINNRAANGDGSPATAAVSTVTSADDKLVQQSPINLDVVVQPRSIEAAAHAVIWEPAAKDQGAPPSAASLREPVRRVIPAFKSIVPVIKTRRRLITWLAVGAAGGFALSHLDFEHEEEAEGKGHKE